MSDLLLPRWRANPPLRTLREMALAAALTNYVCAHLWSAQTTDRPYGEEDYEQIVGALGALGVGFLRVDDPDGNPKLVIDPDWMGEVYTPRAERYDRGSN